ncbi:MAG: penicillin-binding protein 2 [Bacteroidaceae bacterium]|nr:penicillin-binding protein 2 [Bacteroidaceae bacterium]
MKEHQYEHRKFVIAGIAFVIVVCYITRLAFLQLYDNEFKEKADNNAFLNNIIFPSRGVIYDRNGTLLVFNQPAYDIMVIKKEMDKNLDTLDFCQTLGITREEFDKRMENMEDRNKNPGFSTYTQQLFMSQIPASEFSVFQEKLFRYRGFRVRERSIRRYATDNGAHVLGDVAEVSAKEVEKDKYYEPGDYIGKQGVERSYEPDLRGVKGVEVLLKDSHGRIQGHYKDGAYDRKPEPGKNITLSIDIKLQALGERLMEGKMGGIVAIEPSTGEILCLVSSPSYNPHRMEGKERGKQMTELQRDPMKPMLNRAVSGTYPPGSTFKTSQGLTFLQEGIINLETAYPCSHGFRFGNMKVGCHGHGAPLPLQPAIATSCNGYFCWGLYHMLSNSSKYGNIQTSMTRWKDYMVSMGFGYRLGVDLPGEARGMIPNADYYDNAFKKQWSPLSVISIAIGQGEVTLTPLQIANLGATIANRGYYITPHVVKHVEGGKLADSLLVKHKTMVEPKYYEYVVEGMRRAVTGGTCSSANTPMYEVCGKTGTAQNRGRDHSAFMGFAPRNNPKIAIAVYVENGGFGATFGVPIGALMMEQYINGELSERSEEKALAMQQRHIDYGNGER